MPVTRDFTFYSFNASLDPLPNTARSAITASKHLLFNLIESIYGITDFDIIESDSGGGQPLEADITVLFNPDDLYLRRGLVMVFQCLAGGSVIGIRGCSDSRIIPEFSMTCNVTRFSANIIAALAMLIISTMELPKETA
jgi:hypothetical protein